MEFCLIAQNSANLAQGSFIFKELNCRRSRVLRIIRKLNSFENNPLYGINLSDKIEILLLVQYLTLYMKPLVNCVGIINY